MYKQLSDSNIFHQKIWRDEQKKKELTRLSRIDVHDDIKRSQEGMKVFSHLVINKKRDQLTEERFLEIDRDNKILLMKMTDMIKRPPQYITSRRLGPTSLNRGFRQKEIARITQENLCMLHRIRSAKPAVDTSKLIAEHEKLQKASRLQCTLPYVLNKRPETRQPTINATMILSRSAANLFQSNHPDEKEEDKSRQSSVEREDNNFEDDMEGQSETNNGEVMSIGNETNEALNVSYNHDFNNGSEFGQFDDKHNQNESLDKLEQNNTAGDQNKFMKNDTDDHLSSLTFGDFENSLQTQQPIQEKSYLKGNSDVSEQFDNNKSHTWNLSESYDPNKKGEILEFAREDFIYQKNSNSKRSKINSASSSLIASENEKCSFTPEPSISESYITDDVIDSKDVKTIMNNLTGVEGDPQVTTDEVVVSATSSSRQRVKIAAKTYLNELYTDQINQNVNKYSNLEDKQLSDTVFNDEEEESAVNCMIPLTSNLPSEFNSSESDDEDNKKKKQPSNLDTIGIHCDFAPKVNFFDKKSVKGELLELKFQSSSTDQMFSKISNTNSTFACNENSKNDDKPTSELLKGSHELPAARTTQSSPTAPSWATPSKQSGNLASFTLEATAQLHQQIDISGLSNPSSIRKDVNNLNRKSSNRSNAVQVYNKVANVSSSSTQQFLKNSDFNLLSQANDTSSIPQSSTNSLTARLKSRENSLSSSSTSAKHSAMVLPSILEANRLYRSDYLSNDALFNNVDKSLNKSNPIVQRFNNNNSDTNSQSQSKSKRVSNGLLSRAPSSIGISLTNPSSLSISSHVPSNRSHSSLLHNNNGGNDNNATPSHYEIVDAPSVGFPSRPSSASILMTDRGIHQIGRLSSKLPPIQFCASDAFDET